MPAYAIPQSGPNPDLTKNLRSVSPGDAYTLLDGTEANSALASVAIARGPSLGMSQAYSTFYATNLGVGETVEVQASNTDVNGDYQTIGIMTSPADSPVGTPFFTDSGSPAFYRVLKSGGTPAVTVQR